MNVPKHFAAGTLRLSLGRHTTEAEIDLAVKYIVEAVQISLKEVNERV